jgi:hypothetical protein
MLKLVKLHQFTYTLNLDTGDVVANESKGDRPVVDLATKLRVYATHAKQEKLATVKTLIHLNFEMPSCRNFKDLQVCNTFKLI